MDRKNAKGKIDMKRCCNTCIYKNDSYYGCSKANVCYNGFSAYSPNTEIIKSFVDFTGGETK